MNRRHGLAAFIGTLFIVINAVAADPVLVLSLKTKTDGRVVSTVEFFTCEKDPNVKLATCPQHVLVDGKKANVPERILQRLDSLRRSFSYDSQSGGIRPGGGRGAICMMGGPSQGAVLEVRYLTYNENFKIVADEMKPVIGVPGNCLFTESYSPTQNNAREDARAVAEILETIRGFVQAP
jgi:hypothetical protein